MKTNFFEIASALRLARKRGGNRASLYFLRTKVFSIFQSQCDRANYGVLDL